MVATLPPITLDMLVVFGVILIAFALFVSELVSVDVTALVIVVLLVVLSPWTQVSPADALSGFSNEATITVLAMLILSEGVRRTGAVQLIGTRVAAAVGSSGPKQLLATIGLAGPTSGLVNNTPVVALLVPVISDVARKGGTSPSKLLIPLSYASMFGGTLTLIGTSTNLLASSLSAQLIDRPFSMFEFTQVGAIVLVVGSIYLLTIAPRLLPERVSADGDALDQYELEEYVTEIDVPEQSPLVGTPLGRAFDDIDGEVDLLQIFRGHMCLRPQPNEPLRAEDVLVVRTELDTLLELSDSLDLTFRADADVTEEDLKTDEDEQTLVEVVIPSGSSLAGNTAKGARFRAQYNTTLLALRRGGEVFRERLREIELRVGDTLLLQTPTENIDQLSNTRDLVFVSEEGEPDYRKDKIAIAFGILLGVVGLAALNLLPIVISALLGVVVMVATGVLRPNELYEGVDWSVIFLLAGVIPLGIAMTETGGAELLGAAVAATGAFLPTIAVLYLFYILTGLLTEAVSNNASAALMVPVGISTANTIGANPFAFVLAVTFAASTSFLTPIGYQTNLFVYGPGGYRFTDYFRVGAPLQVVLSAVTTLGIALFFGL
jgi:di/tricarboxylate transporter